MVRRHTTAIRASLMAADFLAALLLFVAASLLRYGSTWEQDWDRLGIDSWVAAIVYATGWTIAVLLQGLYRVRARYSLRAEAIALLRAGFILGLAVITLLFLYQISNASRLLVAALIAATVGVGLVSRLALRTALNSFRRSGRMTRFVLVAGAGPVAQDFADRLERHTDLGLKVLGHLRSPADEAFTPTRSVLGSIDDIERILH